MPKGNDSFYAELVLAKCKVAPIKPQLTIPRVELCAVVIILVIKKDHLTFHISFSEAVFWSDSVAKEIGSFILERFPSYTSIVRILAYIQRLIRNCQTSKSARIVHSLAVSKLYAGLLCSVRICQKKCFAGEWKLLSEGKRLPNQSSLSPLNPFKIREKHSTWRTLEGRIVVN